MTNVKADFAAFYVFCVRNNDFLFCIWDVCRFMNSRVPPNKRYQPTNYEHAANCATHAVNALVRAHRPL